MGFHPNLPRCYDAFPAEQYQDRHLRQRRQRDRLGYDDQGNLANKNGTDYTFDYGNRLHQVENKESYRYDGQGRRVLATSPTLGEIRSLYGQDGVRCATSATTAASRS